MAKVLEKEKDAAAHDSQSSTGRNLYSAQASFTVSEDATSDTPKSKKKIADQKGNATPRGKKNAAGGEKVLAGRVVKGTPKKKDAKEKGIKKEDSFGDVDLDVDAEGVASKLGLDGSFELSRMVEMEI